MCFFVYIGGNVGGSWASVLISLAVYFVQRTDSRTLAGVAVAGAVAAAVAGVLFRPQLAERFTAARAALSASFVSAGLSVSGSLGAGLGGGGDGGGGARGAAVPRGAAFDATLRRLCAMPIESYATSDTLSVKTKAFRVEFVQFPKENPCFSREIVRRERTGRRAATTAALASVQSARQAGLTCAKSVCVLALLSLSPFGTESTLQKPGVDTSRQGRGRSLRRARRAAGGVRRGLRRRLRDLQSAPCFFIDVKVFNTRYVYIQLALRS